MISRHRIATAVALLVVVGVTSAYALVYRPLAIRGKQVHTLLRMEAIERDLHGFYEREHKYPRVLTAIPPGHEPTLDYFGYPFLYLSDGTEFVLVGLGSDGRPDGTNYLAARAAGGTVAGDCVDSRTDLIVSDLEWHRRCGK